MGRTVDGEAAAPGAPEDAGAFRGDVPGGRRLQLGALVAAQASGSGRRPDLGPPPGCD
jgi:hypothetical protein